MESDLEVIMEKYRGRGQDALIPLLQSVQEELGYVSEDAIYAIADTLGIPDAEVFGTLSFYAQFRMKPGGRHSIKICRGTACHVRGAQSIISGVEDELKMDGTTDTTEDGLFTVEKIACFGACSLAPVLVANGETHGRMTPAKARRILRTVQGDDDA